MQISQVFLSFADLSLFLHRFAMLNSFIKHINEQIDVTPIYKFHVTYIFVQFITEIAMMVNHFIVE